MTTRTSPVLDTAWVFEGPDGRVSVAKADRPSQQLGSDPFAYAGGAEGGLQRPPYDMDSLIGMIGADPRTSGNTLHARCVKQKASDIVGRGISLRARDVGDRAASTQEEDAWGAFVRSVESDGEGSLKERLTWAHEDYESVGWAVLEVSRRRDGTIDGLWHVPGHTVRAHVDGRRYAQKRGDKTVWFKRFGVDGTVDRKDGGWSTRTVYDDFAGNELIVIRNYSPASSYYGLPDHIPALSALAGWSAQAQFNVRFFGNQAVPSYAVVIEGATLTPALEATILDHFRQIKGDPARTIVIPIPAVEGGDESMQPKLRFERLSVEVKEASFRLYKQDNALEICIAHGVPPYRVGWPILGSLGGATAEEMTAIYNDCIVQPRQETLEQRLDMTILGPMGLGLQEWQLKCNELDTRNELRDLEKSKLRYELGVDTPADIARFLGKERTDEAGQRFIAVPLAPTAGAAPSADPEAIAKAAAWREQVTAIAQLRETVAKAVRATPSAAPGDPVFNVHVQPPSVAIYTPPITVQAAPAPDVHVDVAAPEVHLQKGAIEVLSPVTVQPASVTIAKGAIQVDAPVTVAPAAPAVPRRVRKTIERDGRGQASAIVEEVLAS
jgi:PBSX family phage portal protein